MAEFSLHRRSQPCCSAELQQWFREAEDAISRSLSKTIDHVYERLILDAIGTVGSVRGTLNGQTARGEGLPLVKLREAIVQLRDDLLLYRETLDGRTVGSDSSWTPYMFSSRLQEGGPLPMPNPPDDTALEQDEWEAKVDTVLADCARWLHATAQMLPEEEPIP